MMVLHVEGSHKLFCRWTFPMNDSSFLRIPSHLTGPRWLLLLVRACRIHFWPWNYQEASADYLSSTLSSLRRINFMAGGKAAPENGPLLYSMQPFSKITSSSDPCREWTLVSKCGTSVISLTSRQMSYLLILADRSRTREWRYCIFNEGIVEIVQV